MFSMHLRPGCNTEEESPIPCEALRHSLNLQHVQFPKAPCTIQHSMQHKYILCGYMKLQGFRGSSPLGFKVLGV